ncbi:MAG: sugar kinase [Proteobacteria bacterium]|nr:sugar kinase [Pseudomonadota bacterium]
MRVASIGECMVELGAHGQGQYALKFGGDTLNTATYLARLGIETGYITALGDDPYSDAMLAQWASEGIDCAQVKRLAGRMPGLYMIETNDQGERRFFYWRDRAPARELMDLMDSALEAALASSEWVYFSGITLSLYGDEGRGKFLALLGRLKAAGVKLAFDGNYRPRGWAGAEAARAAFKTIYPLLDLALPTFEDEQMVFGDADAEATATRLLSAGVREVVVKEGAKGALVATADTRALAAPPAPLQPVDTTAAGDSFNAGYLAARLRGLRPEAAARAGHLMAGAVIMQRGAIIPMAAMPAFDWKKLGEAR